LESGRGHENSVPDRSEVRKQKEANVTKTNILTVVVCMFVVCTGITSAQQYTIKKRMLTVMVEEDQNCPQGISVSGHVSGGRRLCVDYPAGVSARFQKLVGSEVEVEALWTFEGALKRDTPVALGRVLRIGGEEVDDTCATKAQFLGGRGMATSGKDAASTVAALSPGCPASDTAERAAISEISNKGQK
jgi:hypothetical protein